MFSETVNKEFFGWWNFAQVVVEFVGKVYFLWGLWVLNVERKLFLKISVVGYFAVTGIWRWAELRGWDNVQILVFLWWEVSLILILYDSLISIDWNLVFGFLLVWGIDGNTVLRVSKFILKIVQYPHGDLLADARKLKVLILGQFIGNDINLLRSTDPSSKIAFRAFSFPIFNCKIDQFDFFMIWFDAKIQ
jgi:hypothetical protein